MVLRKLFPVSLVAVLVLMFSANSFAQTIDRVLGQNSDVNEISCSPDDPTISTIATAAPSKTVWQARPAAIINVSNNLTPAAAASNRFAPQLMAAIGDRLGARYVWGAAGPRAYDCSGFVWSIYQSIGLDFERGSARTLFARFAPASPEEQYKFGTLVFFSHLAHVGVVADEHGFYHASRHHGVVYSAFTDYWVKRIDGFRRVPLPAGQVAD